MSTGCCSISEVAHSFRLPSCCIWVLQRIIWFLSKTKRRLGLHPYKLSLRVYANDFCCLWLDYHWEELWRALISLLDFLANKTEVAPSSRAERLVQEVCFLPSRHASDCLTNFNNGRKTIVLLDCSARYAESFLPTPQAVHQAVVSREYFAT